MKRCSRGLQRVTHTAARGAYAPEWGGKAPNADAHSRARGARRPRAVVGADLRVRPTRVWVVRAHTQRDASADARRAQPRGHGPTGGPVMPMCVGC